jgi:ribokinase
MDIIGFGALNFDRLYKVDVLNVGDDEIFIREEHEAPGGSGANTIFALGKLGINAGFIGAIGGDREGGWIIRSFEEVGVDINGIVVKPDFGTSLILGFVDKIGERALYVSPKANSELSWDDIDLTYVKKARMVLMSSFVDDKQLELQARLLESIEENVKVILMPGALYAKKGYDKLKPLINRSNLIFLNAEEIKILLDTDFWAGTKKLIEDGIDTAVVTLGANGCYIRTSGEEIEVPAITTQAEDTTGAGDAFAAGFLWGISRKMSLYDCGKAGNFVASSCIQFMGARSGIPTEKEVLSKLKDTA